MAMSKQDKNDAVVSALSHPIRRAILRSLNGSTGSPSTLSDELGEKLPNVSYHVRELTALGVLKLVKTKPRRGAIEHYYKRSGNSLDKRVATMLELIGKD